MDSPWSSVGSQVSSSVPTPWEEVQQQALCVDEVLLQVGDVQCSIPVSHPLTQRCRSLGEAFLSRNHQEFSSVLELCSSFMRFIQDHVPEGASSSPTLDLAILREVLSYFQNDILQNENINTVLASTAVNEGLHNSILRTYFHDCAVTGHKCAAGTSQLLASAERGDARLFALFNGQGVETYFDELAETYEIYQDHITSLVHTLAETLFRLAADSRVKGIFPHGLDIKSWLRNPDTQPEREYLTTAAVSLPLIAVCQLVQYAVACINLEVSPGDLRQYLSGATGHSQGVVVAAFVAAADSWDGFYSAAQQAVEVLFWIGARCHQSTTSVEAGWNQSPASCMLSVKGESQQALQKQIDEINACLPPSESVRLGLVNGPQLFVVSGHPNSLRALERLIQLQSRTASDPSKNWSRVPFSQRPPAVSTRHLPVTVPFHSPYLQEAEKLIIQDLASLTLRGTDLAFPVYHTETAENLQTSSSSNLIPELVRMICTESVQWETLLQKALPGFTHVLDFGPGGDAGVGSLISQQREGTGLRTVIVSALDGPNPTLSYATDLYTRNNPVRYNPVWFTKFAPSLLQSPASQHPGSESPLVNTKFTQLLGLPPLMVAGMTPTTTAPEFVAAIVNAGYHAELACGGFPDADKMREGILSLAAKIPPGRGITCNVIYANPAAMAWQIPLLAELRRSGVPITGLTIGAGVPSPEIVQDYIQELSLHHIGLKPGSRDAIDAVLEIARANPHFPILLQWTGGRGGGHHSYEDFHDPILQRYGAIRAHPNVVLVAGSGFGDGEGTYPYLSGSWAERFGRPAMPFDAILLGSRVMAAKEARTSLAVKQTLCEIPGVRDLDWEGTYQQPTGGILTVRSEMGEPIHKVATRGVMFWAELDRDVFGLPREKQKEALLARKEYYIRRLNEDFQKVWFGIDASGNVVDLQQMTYGEVWTRLFELLYLPHPGQWIDPSFQTLVWDFTRRMEERLSTSPIAILHDLSQLDEPKTLERDLLARYPQAKKEIITAADAEYFILLSRRRGQKPVPYIVALDEEFEYWFKKDSLWQSERLEAVRAQDVGRVCILHGPVAAQYTTRPDEPVKSILDAIHGYWVQQMQRENPVVAPVQNAADFESFRSLVLDGFVVEDDVDTVVFRATSDISPEQWLKALSPASSVPWYRALFSEAFIVQNRKLVANPIHRLFASQRVRVVKLRNVQSARTLEVLIQELEDDADPSRVVASASLRMVSEGVLALTVTDPDAVPLEIRLGYRPQRGAPSITEIETERDGRIKHYYQKIWIGGPSFASSSPWEYVSRGEDVVLTRQMIHRFAKSICNHNPSYTSTGEDHLRAPLDLAIAVAWKPLMSCLFHLSVTGDMLRLLHLSNSFEYCEGVEPLKEGDRLSPEGRLTSIKIKKGVGKVVEAEAVLLRNGTPTMSLKSAFILLGEYTDYETTFGIEEEKICFTLSSKKEVALLKARRWLVLQEDVDLHDYLHKTIEFHVKSRYRFNESGGYAYLTVEGSVMDCPESKTASARLLGSINLSGASYIKNPVTDFLRRHGTPFHIKTEPFARPRTLIGDLHVTVPDHAEQYAAASGDCNPIHVSELFAAYAGHDSRVTHGMFTSGFVRALVESHVAQGDPSRMRTWSCSFDGKVSPGDTLSVKVEHVSMERGNLRLAVQVHNVSTGVKVLSAQSALKQPLTAYVFTGQGSQQQGMGMELETQSPSARKVWEAADGYFEKTYGFSISHIVRSNPQTLTIHFGGTHGRAIRQNYMALNFHSTHADGTTISKPVFPSITPSSRSYTFRSPTGLLHQTQFTQPALALMEIARVQDMRDRGLIQEDSLFAGHSLGEYVALAAIGQLFSVQDVAALVFYRGLTMQNAVRRDANGATDYGMCAVNPRRVSETFSEEDLRRCVEAIAACTAGAGGGLLEIVNLNVRNAQYVCAGDSLNPRIPNRRHRHQNPPPPPPPITLLPAPLHQNNPIHPQCGKTARPKTHPRNHPPNRRRPLPQHAPASGRRCLPPPAAVPDHGGHGGPGSTSGQIYTQPGGDAV
ncbi:Fatty acid synthase subunit beta [Aspergillus mulundensis]|uniref:Fatty acid synthase subunit beta n=1 Tax=Aspergillus mulundensis TaxID=1810919 RepID=A0A3D8QZH7_9EURO|nr:Fatty acid synthase subunit beta [Aspergillus mulundensis]RDW67213.1 Fatty acid synthase subunit beta [Aspergillus mulundensis]